MKDTNIRCKNNELMIGNIVRKWYVNDEDGNPITEAMEITDFIYDHFHQIEPIPLTEEWLLRMGFENVTTGQPYLEIYHDLRIVCPLKNTDKSCYIENDCDEDCPNTCHIFTSTQHVHQLQNLYFALTGEELTIKDK